MPKQKFFGNKRENSDVPPNNPSTETDNATNNRDSDCNSSISIRYCTDYFFLSVKYTNITSSISSLIDHL